MPVVKVIEVLSESERSWEDAAHRALEEASKTIRNIRSLYVRDFQLVMRGGRPLYRLDAKISFQLEEETRERHAARQERHAERRERPLESRYR